MTDDVKTVEIPMPGEHGGTLIVPAELADQIKFHEFPAHGGPPTPPTGMTVRQRLIMCASDIASVGKNRDADAGGGERYKFRGYDAVVNACHPVFAKWGVMIEYTDGELIADKVPRGKQGNMWNSYRLTVEWTFTGWDGDQFTVTNAGEGLDNQDKGLGKARSYALKDLLTRMLLIPTDDPAVDNEATAVPDEYVDGGRGYSAPPERNPADDDAQAGGFSDAADRDQQHAGVVAFIREHVHEQGHKDQLKAMMSPWPMGAAALSMFKQTAMRLADKETGAEPPAGVDADGVVEPEVSDDQIADDPGAPDAPNGAVASEHIRLARQLAPDDADDTTVGAIAQGLADDPELYRQATERDAQDRGIVPPDDQDGMPGVPPLIVSDVSDTAMAGYDKDQLTEALRERGLKVSGPMGEQRARLRAWRDDAESV